MVLRKALIRIDPRESLWTRDPSVETAVCDGQAFYFHSIVCIFRRKSLKASFVVAFTFRNVDNNSLVAEGIPVGNHFWIIIFVAEVLNEFLRDFFASMIFRAVTR